MYCGGIEIEDAFANQADGLHDDGLDEGCALPDGVNQGEKVRHVPHEEENAQSADQGCAGQAADLKGGGVAGGRNQEGKGALQVEEGDRTDQDARQGESAPDGRHGSAFQQGAHQLAENFFGNAGGFDQIVADGAILALDVMDGGFHHLRWSGDDGVEVLLFDAQNAHKRKRLLVIHQEAVGGAVAEGVVKDSRAFVDAERQQEQGGGDAGAVFSGGAMDDHRQIGGVAHQTKDLAQFFGAAVNHPMRIDVFQALAQLVALKDDMGEREGVRAKEGDLQIVCAGQGHVRVLFMFACAAQINDGFDAQVLQQFHIGGIGISQVAGAVDEAPFHGLSLGGLVASQVTEVVDLFEGQHPFGKGEAVLLLGVELEIGARHRVNARQFERCLPGQDANFRGGLFKLGVV